MKNSAHIEKMVDEALNSADGSTRAGAKPYLFTRLKARMEKETDNRSAWETAGRFVARPAVAIAGLLLVICINALVIVSNRPAAAYSPNDQIATTDEFSMSVATLEEAENIEP
jgi:uncharacterized membrane protein YdfJ with MMPL/SSD domain